MDRKSLETFQGKVSLKEKMKSLSIKVIYLINHCQLLVFLNNQLLK